MNVLLHILLCFRVVEGSLLVIENEAPPAEVEFDFLSAESDQLESLLHFAIRHSDSSKLREMASLPIIASNFSAVLDFMYQADKSFEEHLVVTIVDKRWESADEWEAAFDWIMDYGDHLLDKGELMEKFQVLKPLVEWVLVAEGPILIRVCELIVGISQNRESTQGLILAHRPSVIREIFARVDFINDELCASLMSVIAAMLGNNESLQHHVDEDVLVPIALEMNKSYLPTKLFAKTISLFRIVQALSVGVEMEWKKILNVPRLLSQVGVVDLILGEQITTLAEAMTTSGGLDLLRARVRLEQQCTTVKGNGHEWCEFLQKTVDDVYNHTEL